MIMMFQSLSITCSSTMNNQQIEFFIAPILIFVSIIQSVYGVGVLLFGTPLLMLLGMSMEEIRWLVLPVSASISLVQIALNWKDIHWRFIKDFSFTVLPITAITMYVVSGKSVLPFLTLWMGIYLIVFSLGFYSVKGKKIIQQLMGYKLGYLFVSGIIHGLTNLGGSLLSSYLVITQENKQQARTTMALSYLLLVAVQMVTMGWMKQIQYWHSQNLYYILLCLGVFFVANRLLFKSLTQLQFQRYFGPILFAVGCILIAKNL